MLPIHHAFCLSMDILKGISLGSVICINDSIMLMAKNIQLFTPDMILMVPLMIETFARKLEEVRAAGLPAEPVSYTHLKNAVEMEANLFGVVNDTNDKKEGMGAFLEKRAANLTDF